jgi:hypothetical protein
MELGKEDLEKTPLALSTPMQQLQRSKWPGKTIATQAEKAERVSKPPGGVKGVNLPNSEANSATLCHYSEKFPFNPSDFYSNSSKPIAAESQEQDAESRQGNWEYPSSLHQIYLLNEKLTLQVHPGPWPNIQGI